MIVGELEFVVSLDAGEFGAGQARSDLVPARPGQPAGGFLAQPNPIAADYPRTVTLMLRLRCSLLPRPVITRRAAPLDPGQHDLGCQPVPADFSFGQGGHAVADAEGISASGEQERGDVSMQGQAGLDVAVVLDVDSAAKQGPAVAGVVFHVVAGVQQVA